MVLLYMETITINIPSYIPYMDPIWEMGSTHMFTAEARAWGTHPHRGASDFGPGCVSSEPARGALGGGKAVENGYIIIYYHISSYIIIYYHISSYIVIYYHILSYILKNII